MQEKAIEFITLFEEKIVALSKEAHLANFNASISGKEEDYKKASELQLQIEKIFADKESFKKLSGIKNSKGISDEIIKRQIDLLYNAYAENQFDEELLTKIVSLSTEIEQAFATYRAEVNEKKFTDNEIDKILRDSTDSNELQKMWNASKQVGEVVEKKVLELVKLRNEAATDLGYNNFHEMSLLLGEQNPEELDSLFDELDSLTRETFIQKKDEIDSYLAERYDVTKNNLKPWHYQDKFFQQGPSIYSTNADEFFKEKDLVKLTSQYYNNIGLGVDDLIKNSDLYEKEGKYQHAYCTNIDKSGDIRVVCNIKPDLRWMSTMLHEYGHAAYDKYFSQKLPWLLRAPAHIFTTEAIAMLFGRMASNANWMKDMELISETEKNSLGENLSKKLQLEQLVFSRWVQVIYRFEKELYSNPDQDLNSLWWNLVEQYQMLTKPADREKPDWGAKIHIALYPAYYHNYMLGELLASQLYYYIKDKVLRSEEKFPSFANEKDVGNYLINLFMSSGAVYRWDKLILNATGENLSPKYYAKQFIDS